MEQGGTVLWLIAILVFFMWGMIFERIWYLSHGHNAYIDKYKKTKIQFLGSGTILREMIAGAEILQKEYQIDSEIWSVTSFNELRRDGLEVERYNLLNPDKEPRKSYVEKCFQKEIPTLAVSEYQRLYAEQIRRWVNGKYVCLGTDGFGRSDTRENLREFFEIDQNYIVSEPFQKSGQVCFYNAKIEGCYYAPIHYSLFAAKTLEIFRKCVLFCSEPLIKPNLTNELIRKVAENHFALKNELGEAE